MKTGAYILKIFSTYVFVYVILVTNVHKVVPFVANMFTIYDTNHQLNAFYSYMRVKYGLL